MLADLGSRGSQLRRRGRGDARNHEPIYVSLEVHDPAHPAGEDEGVRAGATEERIALASAVDPDDGGTPGAGRFAFGNAVERIVTAATYEHVIAGTAFENIIASATPQGIGSRTAGKGVRFGPDVEGSTDTTHENIVTLAARKGVRSVADDASTGSAVEIIVTVATFEHVIASLTPEAIVAVAASKGIGSVTNIPRAADATNEIIVTVTAFKQVGSGTPPEPIVADTAGKGVGSVVPRQGIVTVTAFENIGTTTAPQPIVADAARKGVGSVAAGDGVHPAIPDKPVMTRTAGENIVAVSAVKNRHRSPLPLPAGRVNQSPRPRQRPAARRSATSNVSKSSP